MYVQSNKKESLTTLDSREAFSAMRASLDHQHISPLWHKKTFRGKIQQLTQEQIQIFQSRLYILYNSKQYHRHFFIYYTVLYSLNCLTTQMAWQRCQSKYSDWSCGTHIHKQRNRLHSFCSLSGLTAALPFLEQQHLG